MKNLIEFIKIRLIILKASIIYTFQIDIAHWANNWGNVISTTIYLLSELIFIEVIYSNVDTIVGYNKNEMLLFVFMGQIWFYFLAAFIFPNLMELIRQVNSGQLDLLLTKPLPSLFYVNFRKINLYRVVRDTLPPMIALISIIDWGAFDFYTHDILAAAIILGFGIICTNTIQLVATLPVFWFGESSAIANLALQLESDAGHMFPYEGWTGTLKYIFSVILPVTMSAGISTSVLLNRSDETDMVLLVLPVTIFMIITRNIAWNFALKHYSSASS